MTTGKNAGIVAAALLLVAVGGCGHEQPPPPPSPSAPASSPSPPPDPPSSEVVRPQIPPAADGTNLNACRKGKCEVLVNAPADIVVRGTKITVHVDSGKVSYITHSADGGTSTAEVSSSGSYTTSTGNGVEVTLSILGTSGNQVVLDISSS